MLIRRRARVWGWCISFFFSLGFAYPISLTLGFWGLEGVGVLVWVVGDWGGGGEEEDAQS